jgi:uncharacterized membrane protein YfhO
MILINKVKGKIANSKFLTWYLSTSFHDVMKKVGNFLYRHIFCYSDVRFALLLYLVGLLAFGYVLIQNYFVIPVSGDFVIQEIPFYYNGYDDWWTFFRTGEFPFWDSNTNLGANNIGSNSFYYLFNVFFLPVLLVPRFLVPQAQAFMILTKFVLAGLVMKKLLNNMFKISEDVSRVVALCYGFSGWAMYYLWFNHFLEIAVLFPLMIYGIEKVIQERKPALLVFSVFLIGITNYFFLISFCFCGVLYSLFRFFQNVKNYTPKEGWSVVGLGILGFAVGLTMCSCIVLPCFRVALNSSRASSSTSYLSSLKDTLEALKENFTSKDFSTFGKNLKAFFKIVMVFDTSNNAKTYMYPAVSFFYPTVSCYDHLLFNNTGYDNTLCSLFLYTPPMLMLLPSLINSIRNKKISHILGFIGLCALLFTPFAYYCFSGFTNVSYGRWQLFVVNCVAIYMAISFEQVKKMPRFYLDISVVFVLAMQILLFVYALKLQNSSGTKEFVADSRILVYVQMGYTLILYLYMRFKLYSPNMLKTLKWATALEVIVMGNILLQFQGTSSYASTYGGFESLKNESKLIEKIKEDQGYYRVFNTSMTRTYNNIEMVEGYNGLGTFHSIYGYDLQDFIDWTHYSYGYKGWSMGDHEKIINFESFLGTKYYLLHDTDKNIPFGLKEIGRENNRVLYENPNYVDLGFTYDTVVNKEAIRYSDSYDGTYSYSYKAYTVKNEYLFTKNAVLAEEDYLSIKDKLTNKDSLNYKNSLYYGSYFEGEVNQVFIPSKRVEVYSAEWNENTHKFVQNNDIGTYTQEKATGLKWNSKLVVDCSPESRNGDEGTRIAPDAKERGGAFITVKQRMGENLEITLYGKDADDKEIVLAKDRHLKHGYNKTYDYKYDRGFYVNDQVYKIEIVVYDTLGKANYLVKPDVTYEYYDTYKARMDEQKKYPFLDVKVNTSNNITFRTSNPFERLAVLSVPYDEGWSLKALINGEYTNIDLYKGNGGFISFLVPEGNVSYSLSYCTPKLSTGALGCVIGSIFLALLYYSLTVVIEDKEVIKKATIL